MVSEEERAENAKAEEAPEAPKPRYEEEAYQRGVSTSKQEAQEHRVQKSYEKGRYSAMTPRQRVQHWGGKVQVGIQKLKVAGTNLNKVASGFKSVQRTQPRYAAPRRYARAPQVVYVGQYGQRVRAPQQPRQEHQGSGGIFGGGGGGNGFGMGNGMFGNQKKKKGGGGIFGG